MKSEKFEEMEAISNLKYQQISGWLKERRGEARFVRDNVQFREMVLALIDYPENENIKTNIREWIKPIVLNHEYSELFLLDKELNTLMTFSENPANQFNFEIVSKFFNGAKGNHIVTTELFKLPNKEPFLLNIVPYCNPENSEEITGYFIFKIEATTQLFPLLAETGLKNTFETYLVVFKTDTALFVSPLKHMKIVPGEYKIPLTKQEIAIVRYQSGEEKLIEGLDYRNVKVLSYTRKITDTNWHLVAEVDQDEIYEQIYQRASNTFVFIAVLILLTGFILFYLWKSREVNFLKKEKEGKKEREALLKQFDYLTRYANDIILLMNDKGKIIWANERALQTYGYSEYELTKLNIIHIRKTEDQQMVKNYMKKVREEGGLLFETEHVKKTGEIFPVEVSSRYIEVDGKFFYQSIIRDISERKEQEKALHLAHQSLTYHVNNTPMAVIEWDKDFRVLKWSSQAETIFGWKAEEVIGKKLNDWRFVFPGDIENVNTLMGELLEGKLKRNNNQNRNFTKKGDILHCNWFNSVLVNDQGNLISILSLVQDVTDQVTTRIELERAYKRNTLLLNTAGNGIMGLNENGELIFINPAGEKILGFKQKELIGREVHNIIHAPRGQSKNEHLLCPIIESLKTRSAIAGYEDIFYNSKGQEIPVEYSSNPVLEEEKLMGSVIVFKDIGERKRIEQELKESRENLAITLGSIGDGVISTNQSGIITGINHAAATLTGWKEKDALGLPVHDVFKIRSSLDFKTIEDSVKKVLQTGKIVRLANHIELIAKNGNIYQIAESAAPILKETGEITGVVMVFRDVTEKYKQEKAMRESEEKFRNLFESADDGMFLMEKEIIIDCNPAAMRLLRAEKKDDLTGKSVVELSPDFQEKGIESAILAKQYVQSVLNGKSQNFGWKHKRLDGSIVETEISLNSTKVENKIVLLASIRDITKRKEAEKEIKLWADIFHNTKVGIVIGSPDNMNLGIMNPAFAEMHGYSPDELKDKPISTVFPAEEVNNIENFIKTAQEKGHFVGESIHLRKDGSEFPVLLDITSVKDRNGRDLYRVVNVQDITERKKSEEEIALLFEVSSVLNESESLDSAIERVLKKICETCDWDYGEAWLPSETEQLLVHSKNFFSVNAGFEEFAKKSAGITYKIGEGLPGKAWEIKDMVWFKEIVEEKNFTRQALASSYGFTSGFSVPVFAGDNLITVLVFFVRKIYEEDSRLMKLINSVTSHFSEVFQRKWAEGEIRKLSVALNQSPVAVEISNPLGLIEYVNQKYLENSGYKTDEVIGRDAGFIQLRETDKEKYREIIDSIRTNETWSGELISRKKDGEYFWEQLNISVIKDNTEKVLNYIAVMEDISARKSMEYDLIMAKELAEEASRLKSSILSNLSHEIRTPLNGILGFSQILERRIKDEENLLMVESIKDSGQRLLYTLSSLVEISALEAQPNIRIKECKLYELVNGVTLNYLIKADEKNIYLKNEVPSDCIIETDPEKLSQALKYLIDNAIKFTDDGGVSIIQSLEEKDSKLYNVISVNDTGIGIPEEKIDKLFEPFWQSSQGHERIYEGIGIGLTIVKKIVTMLDGEIIVKSKPGKGANLMLWLPVLKMRTVKTPVSKNKGSHEIIIRKENQKPRVLIVEDNATNATLLKIQLENCCYTELAEDGEMALNKTKEKGFDIILMDINLGEGMDGVQATQEIRKIPGYEDTPIVAVTGYALPSDKEKFLSRGLSHFLPKPFTQEEVVNLIRTVLKKK